MNNNVLQALSVLYWQSKEVYDPGNSDHERLKEALEDALQALHKEGCIEKEDYKLECRFYEQAE